jgi:signal transduction histidine kinase
VARNGGERRSVGIVFRTVRPHLLVIDISVAAACFLLRTTIFSESPWLLVIAFGMAGTIAIHRLSPALSLGVAWVTVALQLALGLQPDISNAAIVVVLFATAAYGTTTVRWLGFASAFLGALVAAAYVVAESAVSLSPYSGLLRSLAEAAPRLTTVFIGVFGASLFLFLLSWTLGLLWKTVLDARASYRARDVAKQNQASAEREVAIEQERTRIARDMHDVVAHSLAVVIAQADGARYASTTDPSAADSALATISATAREALGDVRMLLGQLRHNQAEGPQPALADLDRLFDQFTASGLTVQRVVVGEPEHLGTAQQLAIYRIIQESLTNALRHADTSHDVVVTFDWSPTWLEISVASTLGEPAESSNGHGIDGMRERAILAGGSLTAEPTADSFVVTATLPIVVTEVPA